MDHAEDITTTSGTVGANAISGLAANNYQVTIVEVDTDCPDTTPSVVNFTVDDITELPVLQISSITDDSSCDDVTPSGAATVNVVDGGAVQSAANFIFNWYSDAAGTIALAGVTFNGAGNGTAGANQISDATEGTYYVRATDNLNPGVGCESDLITITIDQFETIISVADADVTIVDQDDCSPENGSITITQVTLTNEDGTTSTSTTFTDFTFTWSNSGGVVATGNGVNAITGRAADDYTVSIVQDATGCPATTPSEEAFTIEDVTAVPVVQITDLTDDSSCDDLTPSGEVTVNVVDGGAIQTATDFTFAWYAANGTTRLYYIPYDGLAGGSFTIGDNLTFAGAQTATIVSVDGNAIVASALSADITDNETFNNGGGVSAAVNNPTHNITTTGTTGANNVTALIEGTYFVEVTDNTNPGIGCQSDQLEITIDQFETVITVADGDATIQDQEDCSPENGAITINTLTQTAEDGTSPTSTTYADFRFQWAISGGANLFVIPFDNVAVATFEDGETVTINGAVTATVVGVEATYITVSSLSGTISDNQGIVGGTSGTTADVDHAEDITTTSGTVGANAISGLAANNYQVTIVEVDTDCPDTTPSVVNFTVDDITELPVLQISSITDDSSCDDVTPSGAATVNVVDGGAVQSAANFIFNWYSDAAGTIALAGVTFNGAGNGTAGANQISDATEGTYYVRATDNLNPGVGCESDLITITIDQFETIISVADADVTIVDQDDCSPENGSITITQVTLTNEDGTTSTSTTFTDFTFTWSNSGGVVATGNGVNAITGRAADDYTVSIVQDATGCPATTPSEEAFTIEDVTAVPVVQITDLTDDSSCDDLTPSGEVTVNVVDGGAIQTATDFTFAWYAANGTTRLYYIPYDGLAGGSFTIGDNLTFAGAQTATIVSVDGNAIVASALSADITDNETFNNGGGVSAAVNNPTHNITTTGTTGANNVTALIEGTYFVEVTDNTNPGIGCQSDQLEITIDQFETVITVADGDATIQDQEDCSPENGAITINTLTQTAEDGTSPTSTTYADFRFQWAISGGANLFVIPFDNVAVATFEDGETVTINGAVTATVVGVEATYITVSSLSGTISDNQGIVGGTSGTTADVDHAEDITTTSGTVGANAISGLAANNYQVTIVEVDTDCPDTTPSVVNFTVDDITELPVLQISSITDDSSCDDVTPSGAATVNVVDGGAVQSAANFIFNWYSDAAGTIALAGVTFNGAGNGTAGANQISDATEGTYYVRATDNLNPGVGCESDLITITIDQFETIISVADADVTIVDQDDCSPENGSITITQVTLTNEDGTTSTSTTFTDFTFTWSNSGGVVATGNGVNAITGRAADDYTVSIVQDATGCPATTPSEEAFTIEDVTAVPVVQITDLTDDSSCDDLTPSGEVTVNVVDGGAIQTATDFTFAWYAANGTTRLYYIPYDGLAGGSFTIGDNLTFAGAQTATIVSVDGNAIVASALSADITDNETFNNGGGVSAAVNNPTHNITTTGTTGANNVTALIEGTYFVEVTDNTNPGIGCQSDQLEITIDQFETVITVADGDATIQDQEDCSPENGAITINTLTQTAEDGTSPTSTTYADFRFQWAISGGANLFVIPFDNVAVATFEDGETVTINGAVTATVVGVEATYITVSSLSGTISDNQGIVGGTSGTTADVDHAEDITTTSGTVGANAISGLAANNYQVTIVEVDTDCPDTTPSVVNFTVDDITELPVLQISSITDDSSCDDVTPSGAATVNVVDGGAVQSAANFIFNWYSDAAGTIALAGVTFNGAGNGTAGANQISDATEGTYYVRATDNLNPGVGCESDLITITIDQFETIISVADADVTIVDQDDCSPENGSITITQVTLTNEDGTTSTSTTFTDFTFTWSNSGGVVATGNGVNAITGRAADDYTVSIVQDATGCPATTPSEEAFTIEDVTEIPVIQISSITDDSSCDDVTPSGAATVNISDGAGGSETASNYLFNWYESDGTTAIFAIPYDGLTGAFQAGETITIDAGGANITATVISDDGATLFASALSGTISDNETIDGGTSGADAVVNHVLDITTTSGTIGANQIFGLTNGTYFVEATDNTNPGIGCEADQVQIDIDQFETIISVADGDATIQDQEDCSPENGAITINTLTQTAEDGTSPTSTTYADFRFQWAISGGANLFVIPFDNVAVATFEDGETVTINGAVTATVVGVEATYITVSSLSGTISDNQGIVGGTSGTTADVDHAEDITTTSGTVGANAISGLAANNYQVTIVEVDTDCPDTTPSVVNFTVDDITELPVLQISSITDDSSCDDVTPSGAATVNVVDGGAVQSAANFIFNWYSDAAGTIALAGVTFNGAGNGTAGANQISDATEGTYYVRATDNLNPGVGCESDLITITIDQFETIISVADADVTIVDQDDCSPENGSITITQVTLTNEDGTTSTSTTFTDFTFTWSNSGGVVATGNGVNAITGRAADDYTVSIVQDATGCPATTPSEEAFTIEDVTEIPVIQISSITDDSSCDDVTPSGAATVNISDGAGGSETASNYLFNWYESDGTTAIFAIPYDGLTGAFQAGETITIDAGGANITATVISDDGATLFASALSGTISDNETIDGGTSGADAVVNHVLDITTTSGTIGANQIFGLTNGTYFVEATNNTNPGIGCEADQVQIDIDQFETVISVADADVAIVDQEDCSPENGSVTITQLTLTNEDGTTSTSSTFTDFTFTWTNSASATVASGNGVNAITGQPADTYTVSIVQDATGCPATTPSEEAFVIEDVTETPSIQVSSITDDTFCDTDNNGDGTLTIQILQGGSVASATDYSIAWYRGEHTSAPATTDANFLYNDAGDASGANVGTVALNSSDITQLQGLETGDYTVFVSDNVNPNIGCESFRTFTILSDEDIPIINEANIQAAVVNDTTCTSNSGAIVITDADVSTSSGASVTLNDYTATLYNDEELAAASIVETLAAGSGLTSYTFDELAPGDYYLTITGSNSSCESASIRVNIEDLSFNPVISVDNLTANANCGGTAAEGEISISVLESDGAQDSYTFSWVDNASTIVTSTDVNNTSTVQGLSAALSPYVVTVNNTVTGCTTEQSIAITDEASNPIITSFAANNNTICSASNGSFELFSATLDGSEIDSTTLETDYTLNVYSDAGATTLVADGNTANGQLSYDSLSGSTTGTTYYAVLQAATSLCTSDTVEFTIFDNPLNPVIAIDVVQTDSTCSATVGTGILVATGDGQGDDNTNFSFEWFDSDGNSISTNDTLSQVFAGTYQVQVSSANSGCSATASVEIENVPQSPEITDFTVTEATTCNPGNGVLTITGVSIATLDRYRFDFFDTNPLSGSPSAVQSSTNPVFSTAMPGTTYFAVAVDTLTGCSTNAVQVEFGEENVVLPVLQIEDFNNQENCDPGNPNGSITISADGSTDNTIYTFLWTDSDNNVIEANNATASALTAGTYILTATSAATGCAASFTVMIEDQIPPFLLTPTSEANTSCINPNGSTGVTVVPVGSGQANANTVVREAEFYWFSNAADARSDNLANAEHVGETYEGLSAGTYTVIAQDVNDLFCFSEPASVEVLDGTVTPTFAAEVTRNLTVCFEDAPNGFAVIDTMMNIENLDFQWFEGTDITATPIQSGLFVDSLAIGTYTVVATNRISGCFDTQELTVIDERPTITAPTLTLIGNGRTNCLFPDGEAVANSGGLTEGFEFRWYAADDPNTLLFVGSEITTLDTITYEVVAYHEASGCESAREQITIPNGITDPAFTVQVTQSVCLRTEDGSTNQFSGQAFVAIEDFNVFVDSVTYFNEAGEIILARRGSETLIDASPGNYTVNFRASNGCDYSASFSIAAEIQIYNGVSANDDGFNDFFLIDCLDFFENNNVQIFNRDGVKVYEVDNYDNNERRFNGTSNVGSALNLPAGTYFYIIDRGDGSELIQGFLELVR
ncbi:MAG: gliding motility-associated C-terminal domain-containing protein [Cytophagales bacterium]|nr:gliding motility-associated C-terminal domain-containing protein [Cytophagales bacterium]